MSRSLLHTFRIGALTGVPIYAHISVLLIIGLVAYSVDNALLVVSILMFSVLAHEFGHVLAARKYGYKCHRMTFSMFGGTAELELPEILPASQELKISLAGPLVNFYIIVVNVVFVGFAAQFGIPFEDLTPTTTIFLGVNAVLGLFNLVPLFPCDGGRMLRSTLHRFMGFEEATRWAVRVNYVLAAILGITALAYQAWFAAALMVYIAVKASDELDRFDDAD